MGLMGMRGVSIIHASGDGGVGGACRANDGSDRVEFTPQFPPSCPYVTSVGGTMGYMPEKAWWGSSGGFSNYFGRAWYQAEAVGRYVDDKMGSDKRESYKEYANYSGRAFPDLAAHSMMPKSV
jgi:tripeptidyl-peptidase I